MRLDNRCRKIESGLDALNLEEKQGVVDFGTHVIKKELAKAASAKEEIDIMISMMLVSYVMGKRGLPCKLGKCKCDVDSGMH